MRASAIAPISLLLASALAVPNHKHQHRHADSGNGAYGYGQQAPASSTTSASPSDSASQAATPSSTPSTSDSGSTTSGGGGGKVPYSQLIAFGDNLSDNGNGSSAHNVAGNPETIYGFGTWTNGPVAVSYLSDDLGIPLTTDYAYGHADGGSKFGATIDNAFTKSDANAPSAKDQISQYLGKGDTKGKLAQTLHFLWIGNNDVLVYKHYWPGSDNSKNAADVAQKITDQVQTLIDAGAPAVFVPNVYPRHIAPVTTKYLLQPGNDVTQYGQFLQQVNSNLATNLKKFGDKVLLYDVFKFMSDIWANPTSQGFTHTEPGKDFCDGCDGQAQAGVSNWDLCQVQHQANTFFWMQFLDPTTKVHQLIAADMAKAIQGHWGH